MTTRGRILLVDDDVDLVMANKALLEQSGYQVSTAFNGQEGLEAARNELPDLVVLDVIMDEPTEGFDVARALRKDPSTAHVPLLMLTMVNRQFRPLSFGPDETWLPVDRFLDKPVEPQQLLQEIERLLGRRTED